MTGQSLPERRFRLAYTLCTPDCKDSDPVAYDAPWKDALTALAELGYDGVELQVADPATLDVGQLRADLSDAGLAVAAISTGHVRTEKGLILSDVANPGRRRAAIALLGDAIDLAAEFGAVVSIGSVRGAIEPGNDTGAGAIRDAITQLSERAAAVGTRIVLEPQNRYLGRFLNTVAETVAFIDAAGWDNVGVLADTFHMNIEEQSISGGFVQAGDRLWHVQLGENNRQCLGSGSLPLGAVIQTLLLVGYDGWLTMEHAQLPTSRQAAQRSALAVSLAHAPAG